MYMQLPWLTKETRKARAIRGVRMAHEAVSQMFLTSAEALAIKKQFAMADQRNQASRTRSGAVLRIKM